MLTKMSLTGGWVKIKHRMYHYLTGTFFKLIFKLNTFFKILIKYASNIYVYIRSAFNKFPDFFL